MKNSITVEDPKKVKIWGNGYCSVKTTKGWSLYYLSNDVVIELASGADRIDVYTYGFYTLKNNNILSLYNAFGTIMAESIEYVLELNNLGLVAKRSEGNWILCNKNGTYIDVADGNASVSCIVDKLKESLA